MRELGRFLKYSWAVIAICIITISLLVGVTIHAKNNAAKRSHHLAMTSAVIDLQTKATTSEGTATVIKLDEEQFKQLTTLDEQLKTAQQTLDATVQASLQGNIDGQSALEAQSRMKVAYLNLEVIKWQRLAWEQAIKMRLLCKECESANVDLATRSLVQRPVPVAKK